MYLRYTRRQRVTEQIKLNQPGDDTFELMATRGIHVIDRVVIEEMGGGVDLERGVWCIPGADTEIERATPSSH